MQLLVKPFVPRDAEVGIVQYHTYDISFEHRYALETIVGLRYVWFVIKLTKAKVITIGVFISQERRLKDKR